MLKGVDVSSWQKKTNWVTMASRNIKFAWVRLVAFDTYVKKPFVDSYGHQNIKEAHANGILVAPYIYLGNSCDPTLQANFYLTEIRKLQAYTLPICVDVEDRGYIPADLITRVKTCMDVLDAALPNENKVIYSSSDYITSYMKNVNWMDKYYLWIANYGVYSPKIPMPWFYGEEIAWQFSDKGDGIYHGVESKQIDVDVSSLTLEQMKALKFK